MVNQQSSEYIDDRPDRFQARYVIIYLGSLLLAEVYTRVAQVYMMGGWGVLLVLVHIAALGLYFLYAVLQKIALGCWRQLISVICAPFLAVGVFVLQAWTDLTPDYLQFFALQPWYLATIDQLRPSDNAFYAWFWEETRGGVITPTYTLLIYDKTDQITKPPESRTAEWISRVELFASKTHLDVSAIADNRPYPARQPRIFLRNVAKHFYLVTQ